MRMEAGEQQFEFEKNWLQYPDKHYSDERFELAKQSLVDFCEISDFSGYIFLVVGSGSGIYSLAAHELGAERITSLVYDENSIECARAIRKKAGRPDNWSVTQGDVVDESFVSLLEPVDPVYSFGVLHHTGAMWEGLENTFDLVDEDEKLNLALHNDGAVAGVSAEEWRRIKRFYLDSNRFVKRATEVFYFLAWMAYVIVYEQQNLVSYFKNYVADSRGMSVWLDIKDWFGGLLYEAASVEEVEQFVAEYDRGFEVEKVPSTNTKGNNDFSSSTR